MTTTRVLDPPEVFLPPNPTTPKPPVSIDKIKLAIALLLTAVTLYAILSSIFTGKAK